MIIIAIVRIAGFRIKESRIDIVWELFWHQVEASVALIMVSITAFRSLLGIKAMKGCEKEKRERSWFSHRARLLTRYLKKETQVESEPEQLPSIPGATLTGMRTFIHGDGTWDESRAMGMTHKSKKDSPGAACDEPRETEVTHQLSAQSEIFDGRKRANASQHCLEVGNESDGDV